MNSWKGKIKELKEVIETREEEQERFKSA